MMKKSPVLTEGKVREIVHEEINRTKPLWADEMEYRYDEKLTKFKDGVMNGLDKVMGELQKIREETTVVSSYKDRIEDHEERITKIELPAIR